MTINNTWLRNEVVRFYISGEPQDKIANKLNTSTGKVSSLVNEIIKSDDTIHLQRQIAIIAKNNKISIKQIAANLRYKNLIKLNLLDETKSEKFLNALDKLCNKYSVSPSDAAKQFFSIIEVMLRENTEPHKLEESIKSRVNELREIDKQIKIKNKSLEEIKTKEERMRKSLKIKQKDFHAFRQISTMLELYEYPQISPEYATVARALIDIEKMGHSPKVIVSRYEKFQSLTKANQSVEKRLQQSENVLQQYSRKSEEEKVRWKDHGIAFQSFTRLIKNGLQEDDIFAVANILKNDFPEKGIVELQENLRDYGSMAAVLLKKKREYEEEVDSFFEE